MTYGPCSQGKEPYPETGERLPPPSIPPLFRLSQMFLCLGVSLSFWVYLQGKERSRRAGCTWELADLPRGLGKGLRG